ncbi:MAG: hypothetical protein N3A54_00890 [Patescibacteria group bacterium]|nr:hypothetical protein [Patescibacteria group bacterium]
MNKLKKSYFIEDQIPFFIRDNYPLFVSFVKSYYEYLDRAQNELIAVDIENPGKNYTTTPTLRLYVKDINNGSPTYGTYIPDSRPLTFVPIIRNGSFFKVIVKNSAGVKYKKEEAPVLLVQSSTGSGAILKPIFTFDIGNLYDASQSVQFIRDVDLTNEVFKSFLYNEIIPSLPINLYRDQNVSVNKDKFIKFIKQIYNSKGIEEVFSFIYRILYNTKVDFYYPKTDILRTSDGMWVKNYWLIFNNNISNFLGEKVVSESITGIIVKVEPHPILTGKWRALIHERTGNFQAGKKVYLFNFKFQTGTEIGTIHSIEEEPGKYVDDRGFLSSRKKLQDNYYYQEFSYELQSEYNINEFSLILEELLHPSGFKYFIKILIELDSIYLNFSSEILHYIVRFPDTEVVCGEDCVLEKSGLGMTLQHIYTMPFEGPLDVLFLSKTPSGPFLVETDHLSIFNTYENSLLMENTYYGYSVIILEPENTQYRTIVKCILPDKIVLDSPVYMSEGMSIDIYPGYFIKSASGTQVQLSDYDPFNFKTMNNVGNGNRRYLIGYTMYILTGYNQYEKRKIVGYNGTTRTVTLESAFPQPLTTNTIYRIVKDIGGKQYYGKKIVGINVKKGGSNFSNNVACFIQQHSMTGDPPEFSVTVSNGVITNITITNPGTAVYYETPTAEVVDYGLTGTGAILEVVTEGGSENDYYESVLKTSKFIGNSFSTNVNEIFKRAFLKTNVSNSQITSVDVIHGGSGYWFIPMIKFVSGDGINAKLVPILNGDKISAIQVVDAGNYYNYPPRIRTESPFPNSYSFIQQNEIFGRILFFKDDRAFCLLNTDKDSFSSGTVSFRGINMNIGNVDVFTTKNLSTKYTYPTEIEVI